MDRQLQRQQHRLTCSSMRFPDSASPPCCASLHSLRPPAEELPALPQAIPSRTERRQVEPQVIPLEAVLTDTEGAEMRRAAMAQRQPLTEDLATILCREGASLQWCDVDALSRELQSLAQPSLGRASPSGCHRVSGTTRSGAPERRRTSSNPRQLSELGPTSHNLAPTWVELAPRLAKSGSKCGRTWSTPPPPAQIW